MTVQIKKTAILGTSFELQVAAYVADLRAWHEHMARVEADKKNPDLRDIDRHMAHPRPIYPTLVEMAVNENGAADYVIVDDLPTADEVLIGKKARLLQAVSIAEESALNKICPLGKRRLFNMREGDILAADALKAAGMQDSILKRAFGAQRDIAAELEAKRPPEDTAHLADQRRRRDQATAIQRAAAQAHHDIEDLTTDNVEAWAMPDLLK